MTDVHRSGKSDIPVARDESRAPGVRLVTPSGAATYLGLGSRFAIYRLVASGRLPAVRIANKLRIDLRDLDAVIDEGKDAVPNNAGGRARTITPRAVPRELAPQRAHKPKSP